MSLPHPHPRIRTAGRLLITALILLPLLLHADPAGDNPALFELLGSRVGRERNLSEYGLKDAALDRFMDGFAAGLAGQPSPADLRLIYRDIDGFKALLRAQALPEIKRRNRALADAYFARLAERPGVIRLPSGLCYEILASGRGPGPTRFQSVTVNLTARVADGAVFQSTEGQGPADIELISFLPGAVEGLAKIGVGGRIRLHIPPELGYTDPQADSWHIPPGSALVLDIDLLAVRDTPRNDIASVLGPQAPTPPAVPPSGKFSDRDLLTTWGWVVAGESQAAAFGLTPVQKAALSKGLSAEMRDVPLPPDLAGLGPDLDACLAGIRRRLRAAKADATRSASSALFSQLDRDPGVVRLPSGLRYRILEPGTGPFPGPDQRVLVTYTARLIGGKVFDSSALGPMHVDLGTVIPGWTEGVRHINRGGSIRLYIPPELGYGGASSGAVPPGSTLIYDIHLLDFQDRPAHGP